MGLGLPIARSIIVSHGGELAAENAQGGGARVHFSLPVIAKATKDKENHTGCQLSEKRRQCVAPLARR